MHTTCLSFSTASRLRTSWRSARSSHPFTIFTLPLTSPIIHPLLVGRHRVPGGAREAAALYCPLSFCSFYCNHLSLPHTCVPQQADTEFLAEREKQLTEWRNWLAAKKAAVEERDAFIQEQLGSR